MPAAIAAKAVHMMLRVKEEARSVAFYKTVFGLEVAERVEFDTFTLIYMKNANSAFELELTVNKGRTEPYDLGNGYGHLAFVVDDLKALHLNLTLTGPQPGDIKTMNHAGQLFATFFFVSDPDGYKIEVLQKRGRFR
jgi:lactoylglutathione lyase